MRIRQAVLPDCPAIARVQVDSYRTAYAPLLPAPYLAHFTYAEQEQDWKDLILSGRDTLLVAEDRDQILGYALSRKLSGEDRPFDGELAALHVRREFQRRGAGRALLLESARRLATQGCASMGLWVMEGNPAVGFYEHLGGQPCGEQFFEIEEFNLRQRELGYVWKPIQSLTSDFLGIMSA